MIRGDIFIGFFGDFYNVYNFGARSETRTRIALLLRDFKSLVSTNFTIRAFLKKQFTKLRENNFYNYYFEVAVGFAPTNSGFADRRVSYFATRPIEKNYN